MIIFFVSAPFGAETKNIPGVPSIAAFSPAAQAGRRPATACCLPLQKQDAHPKGLQPRRLDICISTRNPFYDLWVKALTNAHPRILGSCYEAAVSPSTSLYDKPPAVSRRPADISWIIFSQNLTAKFGALHRFAWGACSRRCRRSRSGAYCRSAASRAPPSAGICARRQWSRA